ncbi:MAG: hypothetical protein M3Z31_12345 [Pseudomonadota bacterium]|nr:hypothetical protein [Pseudomonadota bacterium]
MWALGADSRANSSPRAYADDSHHTSFTDLLLEHYLATAGFKLRQLKVLDEWLFHATGEKITHVEPTGEAELRQLMHIPDDDKFIDAVRGYFGPTSKSDPFTQP